ncbi:hypothetical protein AURDEDRAFT_139552 [Auricularia subglabra TFB-10046 SS5]|nr:hypothetical protein AURDEDRAFT_139552 [Auricularia subglabra TFB-10046 SS5]
MTPEPGRVASLIQLAWQLRLALGEAVGARPEVPGVIAGLDDLGRTLQHLYSFLMHNTEGMRTDVANALSLPLRTCEDSLRAMKRRVDDYLEYLNGTKRGYANALPIFYRMPLNVIGDPDQVTTTQKCLRDQIGLISTYITVVSGDGGTAHKEAGYGWVTRIAPHDGADKADSEAELLGRLDAQARDGTAAYPNISFVAGERGLATRTTQIMQHGIMLSFAYLSMREDGLQGAPI